MSGCGKLLLPRTNLLAGPLRESLEQGRVAIPKRQCLARILVLIVGEPSYYFIGAGARSEITCDTLSGSQAPSLGSDGRTYGYL
jgi:hypothetical protein